MVLCLHILLLFAPAQLLLVLSLLLLFKIILEGTDLVDKLTLIALVGFHVLFDSDACLHNMLLKLYSLGFWVFVIAASILDILEMVIDNCTFMIKRCNGSLQTFNFDFFLRNLHWHLVLLVIEHVLIVGRADWWSHCLLFLWTLVWRSGLWARDAGHIKLWSRDIFK